MFYIQFMDATLMIYVTASYNLMFKHLKGLRGCLLGCKLKHALSVDNNKIIFNHFALKFSDDGLVIFPYVINGEERFQFLHISEANYAIFYVMRLTKINNS